MRNFPLHSQDPRISVKVRLMVASRNGIADAVEVNWTDSSGNNHKQWPGHDADIQPHPNQGKDPEVHMHDLPDLFPATKQLTVTVDTGTLARICLNASESLIRFNKHGEHTIIPCDIITNIDGEDVVTHDVQPDDLLRMLVDDGRGGVESIIVNGAVVTRAVEAIYKGTWKCEEPKR